MALRRDKIRHFGGRYRPTLVRDARTGSCASGFSDLFNGQAPYEDVLQVWV